LIGGKQAQLRPVIDMGDMAGLTDSEITAIAQAFLSEVETLSGQRGGIYIDASGARDILGASLAQYPLWVANYGVDEPEDNGKWAGWAGWQYTNQGRVPGVKGYVDRDYFNQAMFLEDSTAAPPVDPPAQDDNQITVTVRRGDTLRALAARYDTTAGSIARINDLPDPNLILPGQRLVIRRGWQPTSRYRVYTVQAGDTLSALAARFGTTVESIVSLNDIADPNRITTGQQLRIAVNSQDAVYVVQRGDTLGRIARWSGLSLGELARANGIQNKNLIYPGERILLRP
ncbi:MAG: LysM peptidoglycan-binding domain-containing protein, partial [Christensenellaceae bacterium]